MLTVASVNVNGVRAALRRGMGPWLDRTAPDVLTLQEVRADDDTLRAALGDGWHVAHREPAVDGHRGRAGVAVASRLPLAGDRGAPTTRFADAGRWVEADVPLRDGLLTVVSTYVHTGENGTPRQDEKHAFLDAAQARMVELAADGRYVLVTGDLNVAHHEADLRNWKGNLTKSGFLPSERAYLTHWTTTLRWTDVGRALSGDGPGPYTWWSWRGRAFDNDTGWRIDYQLASPALGPRARAHRVDRAATYAERWSDHAPVVVTYDLEP